MSRKYIGEINMEVTYKGVYFDVAVGELKTGVYDLLKVISSYAKEAHDMVVAFSKHELSEVCGKGQRTIDRYLQTLKQHNIIDYKGRRGRSGGIVISLNENFVHFTTSPNATLNSEEPVSIEDFLDQKLPKKEPENKNYNKKKRNRRTKAQLAEERALQSQEQTKIDELNVELERNLYAPTWEWFQKTDDPVGNYRTYLITRAYNRYAVLFTRDHNRQVKELGQGNTVQETTSSYSVIPDINFLGTSKWNQFTKFRKFCEENGINPVVYLSSQFDRSVYSASIRKSKNILPFLNSLMSDTSYQVYQDYAKHKRRSKSVTLGYAKELPHKFASDFLVTYIRLAYDRAGGNNGLRTMSRNVKKFLGREMRSEHHKALYLFYQQTKKQMREKGVSAKAQETIKKLIIATALTYKNGSTLIPKNVILGSEYLRVILRDVRAAAFRNGSNEQEAMENVLGLLLSPQLPVQEQEKAGANFLEQLHLTSDTHIVTSLIQQHDGTTMKIRDIQDAINEYGSEFLPLDDFSMLDVKQIVDSIEVLPDPTIEEVGNVVNMGQKYADPSPMPDFQATTGPEVDPLHLMYEELENLK